MFGWPSPMPREMGFDPFLQDGGEWVTGPERSFLFSGTELEMIVETVKLEGRERTNDDWWDHYRRFLRG